MSFYTTETGRNPVMNWQYLICIFQYHFMILADIGFSGIDCKVPKEI